MQDFREKDIGLNTQISAVSGLKDSRLGDYIIQIGLDPKMYPVDVRSVSGSLLPDTSGVYNIGSFTIPFQTIYADTFLKTGQIIAATDTLIGVYGISGIMRDHVNNKVGILTSGFLHESGVGLGLRHILTHSHMGAGATSRSDGIFTLNTSGTVANANDDSRYANRYTTAATAGAVAGIGALVSQSLRLQDYLSLRFDLRLIGSGSYVLWAGFMNMNPRNSGVSTVGADSRFRFLGMHATDGTTTFNLYSAASGTLTTILSPPTIPTDRRWHDFHIWVDNQKAYMTIDNSGLYEMNIGPGNAAPQSGSNLGVLLQISPKTNTAVSFHNSYLNVRANSPNPLGYCL